VQLTAVTRFIVLSAVGFGLGSGIFGAEPILSYFATGALGGAALGLVLGDRRKVITLALAGLVGFSVGFFILYSFVPDFGLFRVGSVGDLSGSDVGFIAHSGLHGA